MSANYIAYANDTMTVLYCHNKLSVITDLLHIEQKDNWTIVPLDNANLFRKHTAQELKRLFISLGGDANCFGQTNLYLVHEQIRLECIKLARLLPAIIANGYEAEIQAAYVDKQLVKCGYRFSPNSLTPSKLAPGF